MFYKTLNNLSGSKGRPMCGLTAQKGLGYRQQAWASFSLHKQFFVKKGDVHKNLNRFFKESVTNNEQNTLTFNDVIHNYTFVSISNLIIFIYMCNLITQTFNILIFNSDRFDWQASSSKDVGIRKLMYSVSFAIHKISKTANVVSPRWQFISV